MCILSSPGPLLQQGFVKIQSRGSFQPWRFKASFSIWKEMLHQQKSLSLGISSTESLLGRGGVGRSLLFCEFALSTVFCIGGF